MTTQHHDDRLVRIEDKIDAVGQKIGSIDVTLASQHESLKDHMRRTELLEQSIEPIKKHVNMVSGALKLIGLLATIGAIIEGIVALLTYLGK